MRTSGGIFDVESKADELKNIELSLTQEEIWSNLEKSTELNKRKSQIERSLEPFYQSETQIEDSKMLLDIAEEENDIQTISDIANDISKLENTIKDLEFTKLFRNKMDASNAYIDIQSGSGGTEAQDWAEMLLRMYLRFGEQKGFKTELIEANKERAEFLASNLENITVTCGDGLDNQILEEVNISDSGYCISITEDDEVNILSSLLAKRAGANLSLIHI